VRADAIARRLKRVGDPHTHLRLLGIAVEKTAAMKTALRVADEAYAEVRAQEREREGR
jgi:hypothetical protein